MNPLTKALKIKTGAEQKLQGFGRAIRTAWDKNSQNVENSPSNKRFQAQVKKDGMVID